MSDWLVKTIDKFSIRRYGGFTFGEKNLISAFDPVQVRSALNDLMETAKSDNESFLYGTEQLWKNMETFLEVCDIYQINLHFKKVYILEHCSRLRGLLVSFNLWHKQLTTLWTTVVLLFLCMVVY